ncbi:hypothetical protein Vadar_007264 [Vaccinium darrowii]|uniref:Uncharacterized protein n=1 Tax=Vaccinium darrowii TaxID=229202 RepID=A0ACB7Z340_9ERIC|nr:hypothetical protein Vadar_007264 [Vaccinium darrowii]
MQSNKHTENQTEDQNKNQLVVACFFYLASITVNCAGLSTTIEDGGDQREWRTVMKSVELERRRVKICDSKGGDLGSLLVDAQFAGREDCCRQLGTARGEGLGWRFGAAWGGMWTMTTYKEDEVICTNSQTWMDKKYELSNMTRKMSSNFNIHILLQLLYYFGVKNEVDSLDRASIVVYSCEVSCEGSRAYKEKFVGVQLASQSSSLWHGLVYQKRKRNE